MRILVTGANGQLGNEMRLLAEEHPSWEFIFTDVSDHPEGKSTTYLDITRPIDLDHQVDAESGLHCLCDPFPLDYIVNCAAYTAVDAAEDNEDTAYLLNATAAQNLSSLALIYGATLIHISTDYVFDGTATSPYLVTDEPCPVSAYGRTKLAGEQLIARSRCRHIIIRTAWLYSEFGKNFVKTMLRLSAEKPYVNVVSDQVGSPTFALDLAKAIFTIMGKLGETKPGLWQSDLGGVYHFTGRGSCSWYEFADLIATLGGHPGVIRPCTSAEFPSKVNRPAYSVLDLSRLATNFGIVPPPWQDSLRECLENMGN